MGTGVRTNNIDLARLVDDIIGNRDGSSVRVPVDALVALLRALTGPSYATLAELSADLVWPSGSVATVWNDPVIGQRGTYKKSGASGAGGWTRIGDLPQQIVRDRSEHTGTQAMSTIDGLAAALAAKADDADISALSGQQAATAVIRLTNVGGSGQAATADIAASAAGVAITDGALFAGYHPGVNTAADPTMTVAGVTYTLRRYNGETFAPGQLVNAPYLWRRQSASVWRMVGAVAIDDIPGLEAALAAKAGTGDIAGLQAVLETKASNAALSTAISAEELARAGAIGAEASRAQSAEGVLADRLDDLDARKADLAAAGATAREVQGGRDDGDEGIFPLLRDATGRAVGIDLRGLLVAMGLSVPTAAADRDRANPALSGFADASGRAGAWLDRRGLWQVARLGLQALGLRGDRDADSPGLWGLVDRVGRAPLFIGRDLITRVFGLGLRAMPIGAGRDDGAPFRWALHDERGRGILLLHHDGSVEIPTLLSGSAASPALFGRDDVFNVRTASGAIHASAQIAGGAVIDIYRDLRAPRPETAVMVDSAPIDAVIGYGQSNTGDVTDQANPLGDGPYPFNLFYPGTHSAYGTSDNSATFEAATELRPYAVSKFTPVSAMGTAIIAMAGLQRARPPVLVVGEAWEGGRNIADFLPGAEAGGHWNHVNLLAMAAAMARCGAPYRETVIRAIVWGHGENATAGYQADLEQLIDTIPAQVAAAAGQTVIPHVLLRQSNIGSTDAAPQPQDTPLATLAVARDRLGAGVTLSGPMYHLPLWDNIHLDTVGRMLLGDQEAHAYTEAVTRGSAWHPLWPLPGGVTRSGAVITLPMQLPPDADALMLDDDWVPAVDGRGFVYSDAGSGAAVQSVAILGPNVIVTLTADPGAAADKRISYALFNSPVAPGFARGRGQLYARSRRRSAFRHLGFDQAPFDHIRHYSVKFQESLL